MKKQETNKKASTNCTVPATSSGSHPVTKRASGSAKRPHTPPLTKEAVKSLSDAELLQMLKDAKGHTGTDFGSYMNCEFSYTYLTSILEDRGYKNGWYKAGKGSSPTIRPDIITMSMPDDETVRKSYILDADTAKKWKDFNKKIPFPSVTLSAALSRFMADYKDGKIKFELEI